MKTAHNSFKNRLVRIQLLMKLFLGLIFAASPSWLLAQELTQNAVSNGAGFVSGGNYTGYASAGQMATYMYANGTQIATQGIILNEITGDVEFTFEMSGTLTENEALKSGAFRMKSGTAVAAGTPMAFINVYLIDEVSEEVLFETQTDANGFFQFKSIPYKNYYFTINEPVIPAEPILLTFKSNIFIKKVEVNGEVGTQGVSTSVSVTPNNNCDPQNPEYKIWFLDYDGDGYGTGDFSVGQCTQPKGYVLNDLDCDDSDAGINRDADDVSGSGIDANCDGLYEWYEDLDGDGYGSETIIYSSNVSPELGESAYHSDCDDFDPEINPAASDLGGVDLNCNGIIECSGISNLVFNTSTEPIEISDAINLTVTMEGNGTNSAVIDWGDETSNEVDISEGSISAYHKYDSAGVYILTLTLEDDCGIMQTFTYKYIVIYDPSSGFVTGGGTIYSLAGASVMFPNATGIATFGFVSKYVKNKTVPVGNTEFEFEAGELYFSSTDYEWLIVSGTKAKFKGRGSVNGLEGYQFMISAIDGDLKEKGDPDLFRIKIWNESTGEVIYDNQMDVDVDSDPTMEIDPTTEILAGSIKIHTKKTKSESILTSANTVGFNLQEFNVYPNPTTGKVFLEIEQFQNSEIEISVVNLAGQKIFEKYYLPQNRIEIDLTGNTPGVYFIKLIDGETHVTKKLILKNK